MSENVKHTVLRFAIVFGVILLFFVVVFVRIISLQTVHRSELEAMVADRDSVYKPIKAVRGNIFDCEGRLLASSVPQYSIWMDTRVEALHLNKGKLFYDYVDSIAYGLSRIVGDQTPTEYRNKIVKAYRGKTRRERNIRLTNKRISYTQLKEIKQLPLIRRGVYKSGFYAVDLNLRVKPFNSLGSRTIGGIYAESGKGNAGLEKRFDDYLQGEDGLAIRERMANQWQYIPIREEKHGCDVYTTLDANLMDICESNLRARLEHTQADWGCVILMEVATGEIKAMCNLDRGSDLQYYEIANHAVVRMEPGSTFKTIAMMAALDDGKVNIDDTLRVWKDGWYYHGATHRDAHPADTVYTMRQALAVSSNIALARMITDGYNGSAKKFVNKLKRMGLCDSIDYIIPGAHQPRINIPKDTVTISRMAYGYSVELSPLQILTFYNGIANRSDKPLYLYDLAVVTKAATAPATVKKLWKNDNIKGIKSGNLVTQRILHRAEDRPADFTMMYSNIDTFDIAYKYGIDKNLDGMFSCTPKTARRMYDALAAGDQLAAAKALDEILGLRDLFVETKCLLKAYSHAMHLLGCEGSFARDYEKDITDEQHHHSREHRRREEYAVVGRAEQHSRNVWHCNTNKAYGATEGGYRASKQSC